MAVAFHFLFPENDIEITRRDCNCGSSDRVCFLTENKHIFPDFESFFPDYKNGLPAPELTLQPILEKGRTRPDF